MEKTVEKVAMTTEEVLSEMYEIMTGIQSAGKSDELEATKDKIMMFLLDTCIKQEQKINALDLQSLKKRYFRKK